MKAAWARIGAACWVAWAAWSAGCGGQEPIVLGLEDEDAGEDSGQDAGGDASANNGGDNTVQPDAPPSDTGNNNAPQPDATPSDMGEPDADQPDVPGPTFTGRLAVQRKVSRGVFATSSVCADCHSASPQAQAMRDSGNQAVGPFDLWRSSMMAMASRDPFWRAQVSAEEALTPDTTVDIEVVCMGCHAPMGERQLIEDGLPVHIEALDGDTDDGQLGLDGVSCAVCHLMTDEGFGRPESFTAGFKINEAREVYGPFDAPMGAPMMAATGYTPVKGEHINKGAACGTCHTLFTPSLDAAGRPIGISFPEQTTYLEWRNSTYSTEEPRGVKARDCVVCHMPSTDTLGVVTQTQTARSPEGPDFPGLPERDLHRHQLMGSNITMLAIMRDAREELAPEVPRAAFDMAIQETIKHMAERSGKLELLAAYRDGGEVVVRVRVYHDAAHKFPTGFPSRRAWLRVRLLDAQGGEVFVSGGFDAQGHIVGPDGQPLPAERPAGPIYPHRAIIRNANEVQVYESVMGDPQRRPTATLLRASLYLKDNRLLPEGYRSSHPDAPLIAPVGVEGDLDFENRQDIVEYRVAVGPNAPARVEVSLHFQTLGRRFLNELFEIETPEVAYFQELCDRADLRPHELARVEDNIAQP